MAKSFKRKGDAQKWLASQITAEAKHERVDPRDGSIKLTDWAEQWSAARRVRESTAARDTSLVNSLVAPHLGSKRLVDLTSPMLESWVATLERSDRSPATIVKAFQAVSAMLEMAVRDGRLVRNPARHIELPQVKQSEMRFLDADQIGLLASSIDPRFRVLVLCAGYTGMRFGELAGLQVRDLDLLRDRLRVVRAIAEVRGQLIVGEPKTPASRRTIALPKFLTDAIARHLREKPDPESWVFVGPSGGPLRRNSFRSRYWLPAVKAAGLEGVTFHALRHSHASLLIAGNEHVKTIQSRLGHASITTTLNTYGHLLDGLDQAAAERLDAIGTAARLPVAATISEISRTKPRTKKAAKG